MKQELFINDLNKKGQISFISPSPKGKKRFKNRRKRGPSMVTLKILDFLRAPNNADSVADSVGIPIYEMRRKLNQLYHQGKISCSGVFPDTIYEASEN